MKNVAGTWCRSRRARMRGIEVVAPYSPTDRGTGSGFARCSNSLSTSKERQTATRAPLGQTLGVSFLPILAVPTACRIWASVESTVMGFAAPGRAGDWEFDDELKTKPARAVKTQIRLFMVPAPSRAVGESIYGRSRAGR